MRLMICTALVAGSILAHTTAVAEDAKTVVSDYEERLEAISKEILQIRQELEDLVGGMVAQEMGRVHVFVDAPEETWLRDGIALRVDGKLLFSRALSPAERALLDRGLPVEIADLQLVGGDHQVLLHGAGGEPPDPVSLTVQAGGLTSWVATWGETGLEWRSE